MSEANGKSGGAAEAERKRRLAEALRANLRRRKVSEQRRTTASSQSAPAGADESRD